MVGHNLQHPLAGVGDERDSSVAVAVGSVDFLVEPQANEYVVKMLDDGGLVLDPSTISSSTRRE